MTGTMIHLSGKKRTNTWDTEDAKSVEQVRREFDQIVASGGRVGNQETGERLTSFDPSVRVMEVVSPMAGG